MKFPNHIILDWNTTSSLVSAQYWFFKCVMFNKNHHNFFFTFLIQKKITNENNLFLNNLLRDETFYTITSNKKITKFLFKNSSQNKHLNLTDYSFYKKLFSKITNNGILQNKTNKNSSIPNSLNIFKNNLLWTAFDLNFLKKEKIYTKLKYSRVPQYDIVSGGVAALFAGFLGFLICEKFGFELLDSGDFYILFMYIVFLCFFIKLFLKLITISNNNWTSITFKWFFLFYKNLFGLIFKYFNLYFLKK